MSTQLVCPACRATLDTLFDDKLKLEVDRCLNCNGLWFDGEELGRFLRSRQLKEGAMEDSMVSQAHPETDRECPRCDEPLTKVRVNQTTLDRCQRCSGLWFDHGELEQLREEARSGLRGDSEVVRQFSLGVALESADQFQQKRREELLGLCQFLAVL